MRGLASAVSLVSCRNAVGDRFVMPATSVTPVSMEPPSILMCINRSSSTYPALIDSEGFGLSILGAEQAGIARMCTGGAAEARFGAGLWQDDPQGVPYLANALAVVICGHDQRMAYGSHDIFIGRVRSVVVNRIADPLVYANGSYQRLTAQSL